MRITDDNLHGRVVLTADGLAIGEVNKLFFHGGAFAIDAIEIKVRREMAERLGLKHSPFKPAMMEIPAGAVQSVGDAVILSAKLEELGGATPRTDDVPETRDERDARRTDVYEGENVRVTP